MLFRSSLDGQYAAFGTVTSGMDIVDKICKDCTDTNQKDVYKRQELGRETVSAYAAAKGGLKMLTRNICSEYGQYNIQCNGIGPVSYTHLDVYKRQD